MVRDITDDPEFRAASHAKTDSEEGTYFCTTFTPEALAFYRMCVPPDSGHVLQAAVADVRARLQNCDRNRGVVYRHYVAILEVPCSPTPWTTHLTRTCWSPTRTSRSLTRTSRLEQVVVECIWIDYCIDDA